MNLFFAFSFLLMRLDLILTGVILALCVGIYHQEKTTTTTAILILAIINALKSLFTGIL